MFGGCYVISFFHRKAGIILGLLLYLGFWGIEVLFNPSFIFRGWFFRLIIIGLLISAIRIKKVNEV